MKKEATSHKIKNPQELEQQIRKWQDCSERVVFSNGCFDILHLGHIDYLEKARGLGDRLVIGLNTDASVKALKGPQRPINDEYARARMLAALAFVDGVVLFGEDTPYALIERLKPDILVKGDDYLAENIVGADIVIQNGGEVKTVALVKGFSTSNIIEKIRNT